MKKFLIICCILVLILAVLAVALWMALPSIGTHLLGRAIGGSVQVSRFERGYSKGALFFDLGNVTLKGGVEGTIKDWRLQFNPWKGLYITYVSISDFELTIKDSGGKVEIVPVPVELAQFTRGNITYKGQKFIIREIKVKNFNTGGTPEFELDGGAEGLGNLKTKGGGFFKDKRSDIQGELSYSQLDMSRILRGYEGFLSGSGNFTYKDGRLTCVISVEGFDFAMRENFLRKPLRVAHGTAKAEVVFALSGMKASVHLENLFFKEVPVDLKFSVVGKALATVELRTGFVAVSDVKEYIDLVPLAKRGADVLALLTTGRIMIKQLNFTEPRPFLAELQLADVSASYEKIEIHDIDAIVKLTDDRIIVSNAKGSFERSSFYDVSGNIPFAPHKEIEGKGRFSVDAKDLASLLEPEGVRITAGTADGQAEVKGKEDKGLMVAGTGTLRDAEIIWRGLALKASGSYRFHDREVVLEPLVVSRGTTQVTVKGSVQKDITRFDLNGTVGAAEIKTLFDPPYPLDGVVIADGELVKEQETISARGALSLKDLSVEVPGFLKKERGVESSATFELRWDQGVVHINRLTCTVADASLQASADVTKGRVAGLKMSLDVPRLETISRLLFASRIQAAGSLKLNTSVSELRMPVREIPPMNGELRLRGGVLNLPSFVNPLTDIELSADFKGNQSSINLVSLRIGKSLVRKATLLLDRQASPRFSMMIDMENFEPADFAGRDKRRFRIPVIDKNSLMATLSGDLKIRAARLAQNDVLATDLELSGTFRERRLDVEKLTGKLFGGTLSIEGKADLSGPLPALHVSGIARDVKGATFIRLFDPESEVLEATGAVAGSLSSTGSDSDELVRHMGGTVSAESRNGVIKKWNLLSKIFGLLNVYDFFRGKVDLLQVGLPYTKAGLTLQGENGVFRTEDFLIDSPSMVIAGQGVINLPDKVLDGKLVVSPLVAVDRTIDWIPIVRSIFKRKEGGLMYVAYDIKGPLRDPELHTSYVDSIGKRPIDFIKNIILLPKGIFER